jgi:hypothetical protein
MRLRPLSRAERIAVCLWLVVGVVAWNAIYDVLVSRGTHEFLTRQALSLAGRGPVPPLAPFMDVTVRYASWIATLWACILVLAGMVTIRLMRRAAPGTSN